MSSNLLTKVLMMCTMMKRSTASFKSKEEGLDIDRSIATVTLVKRVEGLCKIYIGFVAREKLKALERYAESKPRYRSAFGTATW